MGTKLLAPLNISKENILKANRLYQQYHPYVKSAVKYYKKRLNRVADIDDLESFILYRFWLACLKADMSRGVSSYLYQTARFAGLMYTSHYLEELKHEKRKSKAAFRGTPDPVLYTSPLGLPLCPTVS